MISFADRVRSLRGKKSLKAMESITGIPAATIERIEKGLTEAKVGHVMAYHLSCGVSADYLLGLSDNTNEVSKSGAWQSRALVAEQKLERVNRALGHALKGFEELQEAVK